MSGKQSEVNEALNSLTAEYGYEAVERAFSELKHNHKYETRYADTIDVRRNIYRLIEEGKTHKETAALLGVTLSRVKLAVARKHSDEKWAVFRASHPHIED